MTRRRLDALLLLDKPSGVSSNGALQQAKRLYRAEKAGHAGTLDPLASGLLPILFGEATKFSYLLLDSEKEYDALLQLGASTSTGDAEGEVIERRPVEVEPDQVKAALQRFRGEIEQVPPMYSALKYRGRPLYELARSGEFVQRVPRKVTVSVIELVEQQDTVLRLRVRCSKGTYVRSLAVDLGAALGTCAHLAALRRTRAGGFDLRDATSLAQLGALDETRRDELLRPLRALLEGTPTIRLDADRAGRFAHGQPVAVAQLAEGRYQVCGPSDQLLGLGECQAPGMLRPTRLLAGAAEHARRERKSLRL